MTPWFAARLAYVAAAANLSAALAMLLALRPGMAANPDVLVQATYIAAHPGVWIAGWAAWNLAALSLLAYLGAVGMMVRHRGPVLATFGMALAALGIVPDLAAEALQMGVLPQLSVRLLAAGDLRPVLVEQFLFADRISVLLTGFLGNGLYTLAGSS